MLDKHEVHGSNPCWPTSEPALRAGFLLRRRLRYDGGVRSPAVLLGALVLAVATQAQTAPPAVTQPIATPPPSISQPIATPGPGASGGGTGSGRVNAVPRTWHAPEIYINPKDWLPSPSPSPRHRAARRPTPRPPHAVPEPDVFHTYDTGTPPPLH